MVRIVQPSFARGELGPDLWGRVDVAAYRVALRTALNVIIHAYGGASNRPGLRYVGPARTHDGTPPSLIEFKFNTTDTYILEFGKQYMRVIRNDAHVLRTPVTITNITQASPGLVLAPSHGLLDNALVYISDVQGMTELNNRWFLVGSATVDTFELLDYVDGTPFDTSALDAYTSGGQVFETYEIATPYDIEDVHALKHVQSANVMTLVHPSYPPQELSRIDHDDWTLSEIVFAPEQPFTSGIVAVSGSSGLYQVTAINEETQEESLPGLAAGIETIVNASQTNPVTLTLSAPTNFVDGDEIAVFGVEGMTELNGRRFKLINTGVSTVDLEGEDGTSHNAYTGGGVAGGTVARGGTGSDADLSWQPVEGASRYSVYRSVNGLFGWIGDTETLRFIDQDIDPDFTLSPPKSRNPFFGADNYPAAVSYYEQRRVFGRTNRKRDTTWYSVAGSESNFSQSTPRQADDSITATLNSRQVNDIRNFVPGNDLLIMTSGAEWRVNAGSEAAFSAETLRQKPQSEWGSDLLDPVVVGDQVLYVTENQSYVRSLGYEITVDGYRGADMTVFSPHIFRDYKLVDWAFSRWPDPVITAVRADGFVGSMTFNPEQEVVAWTRWNTDGKFLRVASTRPSSEDPDVFSYFVISRKIDGKRVYYIERVASRRFLDVRDCFFVDSGLTLDEPMDIVDITLADPVMIRSPGHGLSDGDEVDISDILWESVVDEDFNESQPEQLNFTRYFVADSTADTIDLVTMCRCGRIVGASKASQCVLTTLGTELEAGDKVGVFYVVGMTELNGHVYDVVDVNGDDVTIDVDSTGFSDYEVGGELFPTEDGSAFLAYEEDGYVRKAVDTISNLWHLEGRDVVILADGDVVADKSVSGGQLQLDSKASRVHVGLRFISDIETLNPEIAVAGQTIQGRAQRVPSITARMKDTRGLLVGPDRYHLAKMKQRELEDYGEPTRLLTGDKEIDLFANWAGGGRVFIRQPYPLPMTLTAVIPHMDIGDEED